MVFRFDPDEGKAVRKIGIIGCGNVSKATRSHPNPDFYYKGWRSADGAWGSLGCTHAALNASGVINR